MSEEHDVAAIDELAGGALKVVEIGEAKILLSRASDEVHAVGATCPHAGGPLAEGARNGDRIVCPWHKATFCLRSGQLLEPPAVDDLPRYRVRVANGRVLVSVEPIEAPDPSPVKDARTFVIVGSGAAGAVAAQTLREEGFGGAIIMLDRENRVPYDRTLLSKYHLSGEEGGEKTPLQTQAWYQERRIERRTADVSQIDRVKRRIVCADGSTLSYDKALLATGATPTPLKIPGHDLHNVFTLRSRADADAILARAERSTHAVVLGASFIGMEVAAALRERGLDVTVVAKEKAPFERQLGVLIGGAFAALHAREGVALRLGTEVAELVGKESVSGVRLKNGDMLPADFVVAGFGVNPVSAIVDGVPHEKDGGLRVDSSLRVAADLYAGGDIVAFPYRQGRIRVEHWRVAQQHGRIAALNMLGRDMRYTAPPVFWTIQYMKRLDYIGHAKDWDDVVVHGDLEKPEFLAYYVKDGRVAAAVGMDRDRDTAALVELFAMRAWKPDELGDDPKAVLAGIQKW